MKKYLVILSVLFGCYQASADDWVYTVRPNDTVKSIVDEYLTSHAYDDLLRSYNNIDENEEVRPGTRLHIPYQWLTISPLLVTLDRLSGKVYKISKDNASQKQVARLGETFYFGDSIETGEDSSAILLFADGTKAQLKENTSVTFDVLNVYGESGMVDSKMLLNRGRVNVNANPSHRNNGLYRFEVKTPLAISAVRGTQYSMSSDENLTTVELFDGKNIVTNDLNADTSNLQSSTEIVELNAGHGTFVDGTMMVESAINLLPKIDASNIDSNRIVNHERAISWQAVEGASAYYIEIAKDANIENIVWIDTLQSPELVPTFITDDSHYYMRISAVDENGIMGYPNVVKLEPQLYPQAPTTFMPTYYEMLNEVEYEFTWSADESEAFLLEISDNESFTNLTYKAEIEGGNQTVRFDNATNGVYYWRISKKGEDGNYGEKGLITPFYLDLTTENSDNLADSSVIKLPDIEGIEGFRFQLFASDNPADKIWDKTFKDNNVRIPKRFLGTLFFRVAIIDSKGEQAAYSEMKQIERPNPLWQLITTNVK